MTSDLNIITIAGIVIATAAGVMACGVTLLILWLAARPRGSR